MPEAADATAPRDDAAADAAAALRQRGPAAAAAHGDEPPAEAASDAPGPPDLLAQAQAGSAVHRALAELSAQERWLLGLAYCRDLTHAQIATATALPLGTVKSALLRAQHKLRERLNATPSPAR